MLVTTAYSGGARTVFIRPSSAPLRTALYPLRAYKKAIGFDDGPQRLHSTAPSAMAPFYPSGGYSAQSTIALSSFPIKQTKIILTARRTILSSSSFSALPPEEEEKEKSRVDSITKFQREMELRRLDSELARLQTLRAINTGELYTLRGKFKMLSRDYGMGFLAWYWTVWFATAGLSYAALELGGLDPLIVAGKLEAFLGWEPMSISGRVDPTMGQIGLVVVLNEFLEPLRLPFVVLTTKPVVHFFSKPS